MILCYVLMEIWRIVPYCLYRRCIIVIRDDPPNARDLRQIPAGMTTIDSTVVASWQRSRSTRGRR